MIFLFLVGYFFARTLKMCEVTASNFPSKCDEVIQRIQRCDFVAFDTEFTALRVSDEVLAHCGSCLNLAPFELRTSFGITNNHKDGTNRPDRKIPKLP